jgi:hypothetical protein
MSDARPLLERLLRRAEGARLRGEDAQASLSMASARDAAEYLALQTLPELERFHAGIALAERTGAIAVQRDVRRGDGEKLLRVAVIDAAALARHLGIELIGERSARATATLAAWQIRFPVVTEVLEAWRKGRKIRGHGPEAAADLADAARAVNTLLADTREERILRMASANLFGDSKRLEALTPWLDVLVAGEPAPSGLEKEQIWSALGLRREPQPLLLAGVGHVELDDGTRLPLPRTYLGIPVEALRTVETAARHLLSIENLASFHGAVRTRGDASILLLYTGGMPSPTWRAAYRRILGCIRSDVPVHHWGDIDEGGFRIAAKLAETTREAGFALHPWLMQPDAIAEPVRMRSAPPSPGTLASMCRWAERTGWPDVAEALRHQPITLEQESLRPVLPP